MELWVGPVIVAAAVSAFVSVAGWFVTSWQSQRQERLRREEKVHDFQVALRAEIASDLLGMVVADRDQFLLEVREFYESDPDYAPVIPHLASNAIFEALVDQIHILPGNVIEPVVRYERLRQTVERFIADMRAPSFSALSPSRQLTMYSDYLGMLGRVEALAQHALAALDASLNNSAAVPSIPASALGPGEAAEASSGTVSSP